MPVGNMHSSETTRPDEIFSLCNHAAAAAAAATTTPALQQLTSLTENKQQPAATATAAEARIQQGSSPVQGTTVHTCQRIRQWAG